MGYRFLLVLLALSVLTAPAEYLVHEGAHYLTARSFGAHASVHFDRVTWAGGASLGHLERALFAAAGPAVDWIVGMGALLLLTQCFTRTRLVLAIWVARPLQFLPALLGIDLSRLGISGELDGTDEAMVAGAVGIAPPAILWLELVAAMPLLAWIAITIPAASRLPVLAILSAGVLSGWAAWLTWGPYILP